MEWPEKIIAEMDKDVNGIWFSSFSPLPLVYGKCDYIRADLVANREQELNSKISDLTILLDNCKVGAAYSENIRKERKIGYQSQIQKFWPLRKCREITITLGCFLFPWHSCIQGYLRSGAINLAKKDMLPTGCLYPHYRRQQNE